MSVIQIVLLLIVAAITGIGSVVDEAQTHRPLVACTLVGIVLGDIPTGIILGGTLEMMALGWMNVGLAMAPDTAIASVISTILVINSHQGIGQGIARAHLLAMSLQALRVMIPTLIICLISATAVQHFLSSIPEVITRGLQIGGGIIVVVGYAMVINMMDVPYLKPFMYAGFLFAAFTNFNLVGFGALGLIAALIYLQLKYNNQPQTAVTPAGVVFDDDDDDLDA